MIKEEGEKRNFLSDYFSVKPVCPCPTAGGPARRQAGTGRESRCGMQAGLPDGRVCPCPQAGGDRQAGGWVFF